MRKGESEAATLDVARAHRVESERLLAIRDAIDIGGAAFPPPRAPLEAAVKAARAAEFQAARDFAAVWA